MSDASHVLGNLGEQDRRGRRDDQCDGDDEDVRGPEAAAKEAHDFSVGRFRGGRLLVNACSAYPVRGTTRPRDSYRALA